MEIANGNYNREREHQSCCFGSDGSDEEAESHPGDQSDGSDEEAEFTAKPKTKKGKQKNPKFQTFFHTINKRNDDVGTDEDFILETKKKLKAEFALRFTKLQTLKGLESLSLAHLHRFGLKLKAKVKHN